MNKVMSTISVYMFLVTLRKFNHLLKKSRSVLILASEFGLFDLHRQSDDHEILKFVNTLRTNNFAHKIFVEDLYDKFKVSRDDLFFDHTESPKYEQ